MDVRTDGQLLAAHRSRDVAAFEELVRRHEGALLSHARAPSHEAQVEDVVASLDLAKGSSASAGPRRGRRSHPRRGHGTQSTLHPFVRLNVLAVQKSAASRYQTW